MNAALRHAMLAALLLAAAAWAQAHGLRLVAHAEGEFMVGRAFYSDLTPAPGLLVEVFDSGTTSVLATGVSDGSGGFRIPVPLRTAYTLVVEGEEGHRAEITAPRVVPHAGNADALQLLREDIARLEHRIRLRDIAGGIGYILGLLGLSAWFLSRRRN